MTQTEQKSESTFPFSSDHERDFGGPSDDSAIAHAWARAYQTGFEVGPAISGEFDASYVDNNTGQTVPVVKRRFQYAIASMVNDPVRNPNKNVMFYGPGGAYCVTSGL